MINKEWKQQLYYSSIISILQKYKNGTLLRVIWEDNTEALYSLDTLYDTDNGLELYEPEYKEYHAALLELVDSSEKENIPEFIELGDDSNNPMRIELAYTKEIIWSND